MQKTPAGHEIPVPSREEVFRDLGKVAKSEPPKRDDEDSDARVGGSEEE